MKLFNFKRERIYCIPNKFGFVAFGLFLVTLSAAGTYQNNLVFMMSFLLLSLGLIGILQTARNIRDVTIVDVNIKPAFAGEITFVQIALKNPTQDIKLNLKTSLKWLGGKMDTECQELQPGEIARVNLSLPLNQKRGIYKIKRLGLETLYPYSLFNAWKYEITDNEIYIYPKPFGADLPSEWIKANNEDFSGHKKYVDGDSVSRIDWKVYSKTNDLYIREFKDSNRPQIHIDWAMAKQHDLEDKLSQLSLWIFQAHSKNINFEVQLPGFKSGMLSGEKHYKNCMEHLTRIL